MFPADVSPPPRGGKFWGESIANKLIGGCMKPLFTVFVSGCLGVMLCVPALAAGDAPTSLKQSIESMLNTNNSLKAIQENRSAVGHEVDRAKAGYGPRVDLTARGGFGKLTDSTTRSYGYNDVAPYSSASLLVTQPLWDGWLTRGRVREAAAFVGLGEELLQKSPFELSGGQKRRVAIAGVMAMHPRVLVLDEPAAGLDPEGRDAILGQIKAYHEATGITVLLVSHSMEDIAKYANRVLVLHKAKVAMYDTVEAVFARAQELVELGLSVPQVTQIFLKLRAMGVDIPTDVYTIPYAVKTIQKALAAKQAKGVQ